MSTVTIKNTEIVDRYNQLVAVLQQSHLVPEVELQMAFGLLFADQLRKAGFNLSEAVRAFKDMWALAASSSDEGMHPKRVAGPEQLELDLPHPFQQQGEGDPGNEEGSCIVCGKPAAEHKQVMQ